MCEIHSAALDTQMIKNDNLFWICFPLVQQITSV